MWLDVVSLRMRNDVYSRQILTETDICEAYLRDPDIKLSNVLVENAIVFNDELELENIPNLIVANDLTLSVDEFD